MKITAPAMLTPTRLRLVLSITIALIVIAGGGLFYLAYNRLSEIAAETGQSAASARESEDTLARLQSLRSDLDARSDAINRTSNVMANSQNYAYQDRLVNDLTVYATRANLSIKNISFSAAQAQAAAPAAADGTADPAATGAPAGLNKATVDITLESPVNYQDLLNFLHYVEQNLTKLKISKVVMSKSQSDGVTIDMLNLEVYVR